VTQKRRVQRLLKQFFLERYPDGLPEPLDDKQVAKLNAEFKGWRQASWLKGAGEHSEQIGNIIIDRVHKGIILDGDFISMDHVEMIVAALKEDGSSTSSTETQRRDEEGLFIPLKDLEEALAALRERQPGG
jgi:hypothetical protein